MSQTLQVMCLRYIDTPLTLIRLNQNGDDILIVDRDLRDSLEVIVGDPRETGQEGFKSRLNLTVSARGQGRHGTSVEGPLHHNDGREVYPLVMSIESCKLNRSLIRLSTRVTEECIIHPC